MIDINVPIMLTTAVVFLLLLFILNQLLYKPLLGFMNNRDKTIKDDLENAEKNSSDVVAYNDEINKILHNAKNEASQIKQHAVLEAKSIAEKKLSDKKAKLETEYNNFLKSLEEDKDILKTTLVSDMPIYQNSIKNKLGKI